jgi:hypothetical protein
MVKEMVKNDLQKARLEANLNLYNSNSNVKS